MHTFPRIYMYILHNFCPCLLRNYFPFIAIFSVLPTRKQQKASETLRFPRLFCILLSCVLLFCAFYRFGFTYFPGIIRIVLISNAPKESSITPFVTKISSCVCSSISQLYAHFTEKCSCTLAVPDAFFDSYRRIIKSQLPSSAALTVSTIICGLSQEIIPKVFVLPFRTTGFSFSS